MRKNKYNYEIKCKTKPLFALTAMTICKNIKQKQIKHV